MGHDDPVSRFPPHLSEAPLIATTAGITTAAIWQQYCQPQGGVVLGPAGVLMPNDLPPATIPAADVELIGWLTGADSGAVAGHSIYTYSARLGAALETVEQGDSSWPSRSAAEVPIPVTVAGFSAAVADAAALILRGASAGGSSVAYIPVAYRPKVVSVAGVFQVSWCGLTICSCPTKSAAKTTAKYLFKWLRILQSDSTISVSQLAAAWAAWWAVAVSSSAGFDPPFSTSP